MSDKKRVYSNKRKRILKGDYVDNIVRFNNRGRIQVTNDKPCIEIKSSDNYDYGGPTDNHGTLIEINFTNNGTLPNQHVGNVQYNKALYVRWWLVPTGRSTSISNENWYMLRVALVYDNGTSDFTVLPPLAPEYPDIFQDVDSAGVPSSTVTSGINLYNRDRFSVLRDSLVLAPTYNYPDDLVPFSPVLRLQGYPTQYTKGYTDWYVNLKGIETVYGKSFQDRGMIYLVVNSNQSFVNRSWSIFCHYRLRYTN